MGTSNCSIKQIAITSEQRTAWLWYVPCRVGEDFSYLYLNTDGKWRTTAADLQGKLTGYFPTREEAQALLDKVGEPNAVNVATLEH